MVLGAVFIGLPEFGPDEGGMPLGGVLLPFRKTRFAGAVIVAITFIVSLVVLLMDGNIPVSLVTAESPLR